MPTRSPRRTRAAAVARAKRLLDELARRVPRLTQEFYPVGRVLRALQRERGYAALGHASFRALIEATGLLSPSQAFKLMAIVDALAAEQARALGPERAYAVARLAAATQVPVARLFADGLPADPHDPDGERVAVTELSLSAIAALLRRARGGRADPPQADTPTVRRARTALARAGMHRAAITCARSRGEWWATVRVPLAELEAWAAKPRRGR